MGTRNLTCVFHDGKMKIAQYGQWDGYPSGNGVKVLEFVRNKMDFEKLVSGMSLARIPKESEDDAIGADQNWKQKYPQLSRDMGAGILEYAQNQTEPWFIHTSFDFGYDGLFCEWAYVIDLDTMMLEVYEGFYKTPGSPSDRWYSEESKDGYYSIRKIREYRIGQLPTVEEFLADLEPDE